MMTQLQEQYLHHCDRMHSLGVWPLRYRVFRDLVEEILCDDIMAGIWAMNEDSYGYLY